MSKTTKRPAAVNASYDWAICSTCGAKKKLHRVTPAWLARHRHGSTKFAAKPLPTGVRS